MAKSSSSLLGSGTLSLSREIEDDMATEAVIDLPDSSNLQSSRESH